MSFNEQQSLLGLGVVNRCLYIYYLNYVTGQAKHFLSVKKISQV